MPSNGEPRRKTKAQMLLLAGACFGPEVMAGFTTLIDWDGNNRDLHVYTQQGLVC